MVRSTFSPFKAFFQFQFFHTYVSLTYFHKISLVCNVLSLCLLKFEETSGLKIEDEISHYDLRNKNHGTEDPHLIPPTF